jgi:hypothetical protein
MQRSSRKDMVSNSMFYLAKVIENEMNGNFTKEEGEKIIKHLVQLTSPKDISDFLFKVKLSIGNISGILIEAILNFQLSEMDYQQEIITSSNLEEKIDKTLTINEVVKLLKISRPTLDLWRKNGLESIKKKGRVFIKQSALDSFLKSK